MRERNERGECERDSKPRSAGGQSKWRESGGETGETLNPGIREMAVNKNFTANMSAG